MRTLSGFLSDLADMFETAHAAGREMIIPLNIVAHFGPALREAVDAAHTLERRARYASELEELAREFDPHRYQNTAAEFVDTDVGHEDARIVPFPGPGKAQ